ncbi:MAG: proline dehydrogenase family protein, partial [Gemmatimonadetes bacterium]|nr:proline dehydrogenase family protein [Gemmatimonadota bacterium]
MMRKALLWVSTNAFLAQRLPQYGFVKRATRRFMPGEALGDALDQSEVLAGSKLSTTVTLLGENLASVAEADTVVEHYFGVLSEIAARGLNTEISIKPTQLGLDFGAEDAQARLEQLLAAASSTVWIDMEGSDYVDATLAMFRAARGKYENVGLCLQAYLHRTKADLEALLPLDPSIRLVKGAYN